jgi:hypothetical protein
MKHESNFRSLSTNEMGAVCAALKAAPNPRTEEGRSRHIIKPAK